MGELHEMVDIAAIGRLFTALAVAGPVLGILAGAVWGRNRGSMRIGAVAGLLWGSLGVLNWLLWQGYNVLTNRNGLDSVKNLFVNLTLFVVVGILAGVFAARLHAKMGSRLSRETSSEPSEDPAQISQ